MWAQFPLLEEVLAAFGVRVWPMVEFEADDALAAAAAKAAPTRASSACFICTPDKDLAQCVRGTRVVQFDRLRRVVRDEAGVVAKFGVPPASIADYLALVGDSADGYPGLQGWGAKSAAAVLARFGHIESIPDDHRQWGVDVARAGDAGGGAEARPGAGDALPRAGHAPHRRAVFEPWTSWSGAGRRRRSPRWRPRLSPRPRIRR